MMDHKIKLFAILIVPLAIQSAAITDWNQKLFDASNRGNLELINEALSNGATIDARDNYQYTPLHYAASYGHTEVVNALIKAKAIIDARDNDQQTPLYYAASNGNTPIVNALILAKATIDARNNDQWTPLHNAARYGRAEVVNALILAKATIDARDNRQWTPLHWAAREGHIEVVNALLDAGSNATLLDKDNKTVFNLISESPWIKQNKKDQLTKIIKDHQEYQAKVLKEVPTLFVEQRDQLNIPVPIANLITQYAFGICETEKNNKGENHDKQ